MTKTCYKIFTVISLYSSVLFSQHVEPKINKTIQQEWIDKTIEEIKKNDSISFINITKPSINSTSEYKKISYRIKDATKIQFPNGDWIFFKTNSTHENEKVGDLSIAITNKNIIYIYYGHVCGGIIHFIHNSDTIPLNSNEFFSNFISDTDSLQWIKRN